MELSKKFEESIARLENPEHPELIALNTKNLITAKQKLIHATFIADNIDVFATTYAGVEYPVIWAWLWRIHRHEINDYCPIKNIPADITPEWKEVIYDWLYQIIPSMNGLWGRYLPDGWKALPEYEKNFNWIYHTLQKVETPENEEKRIALSEMITKILDETK